MAKKNIFYRGTVDVVRGFKLFVDDIKSAWTEPVTVEERRSFRGEMHPPRGHATDYVRSSYGKPEESYKENKNSGEKTKKDSSLPTSQKALDDMIEEILQGQPSWFSGSFPSVFDSSDALRKARRNRIVHTPFSHYSSWSSTSSTEQTFANMRISGEDLIIDIDLPHAPSADTEVAVVIKHGNSIEITERSYKDGSFADNSYTYVLGVKIPEDAKISSTCKDKTVSITLIGLASLFSEFEKASQVKSGK